ncbi:MAG TPA: thioredoxin family protein [Verrucomicrobiota bacterium]|nr:thioredoxin family protein [Verrucomicrobiota bacterium]HRZ36953.1 thioredoxin family protein [Candidatus Paceibacterota bacterium]HRZ54859.1 thioredoxin family protein [Candidatus Paceibacterota bacterium]
MIRSLLILSACVTLVGGRAAELTWLTNLEKAQERAKTDKKVVLINFTGSDWCGFCKRLDKQVFATQEFADYAKDNLVLVKADFPRTTPLPEDLKQANARIKNRYEVRGFPTLVMIDGDGRVLGKKVGYGGDSPTAVINEFKGWRKK